MDNQEADAQGREMMITVADARDATTAQWIGGNKDGKSLGDIRVFHQPLLDEHKTKRIGTNSGICIRTNTEEGASMQGQWTLDFGHGDTIQVAGRELDEGTSHITIVGGTGQYAGISGQMTSAPNGDKTYTQTLYYRR